MNYNINELDEQYNSKEKVESGSTYVQENLWSKVEKTGSKIRFAKDLKALYRYMLDRHISWYRKSIVVGALIYFISPIDAIPDLAPLIGYLDDLGVIAAVLKFMGSEIIPYYD
ncbi:MAG: hypothetical protein FD143_1757 [Ignavibacteria bacterium]|nr:MAG: hypothetical protein FD143_1757 [Ignavibacteria bacterium]KAF0160105.1 MAG: hypothetical protein FD188_1919 [Ignavibacteria bacterium]